MAGEKKHPVADEKPDRVRLDARTVIPIGVAFAFVGIVWTAASAWTGRETQHTLERTLDEKRFEALEKSDADLRAAMDKLLTKAEFREWLNTGPRVLLPKDLREAFPEAPR